MKHGESKVRHDILADIFLSTSLYTPALVRLRRQARFGPKRTDYAAQPEYGGLLTDGGALTADFDHVTYTFPAAIFSVPVTVTHTTHYVDPWLAFPVPWVGVGNAFALTSTATTDGAPVLPTGAFAVTIGYPTEATQLIEESTLMLYRWVDGAWVAEPSVVDPATQTMTATATTTGVWMLGALARNRLYLPIIQHKP